MKNTSLHRRLFHKVIFSLQLLLLSGVFFYNAAFGLAFTKVYTTSLLTPPQSIHGILAGCMEYNSLLTLKSETISLNGAPLTENCSSSRLLNNTQKKQLQASIPDCSNGNAITTTANLKQKNCATASSAADQQHCQTMTTISFCKLTSSALASGVSYPYSMSATVSDGKYNTISTTHNGHMTSIDGTLLELIPLKFGISKASAHHPRGLDLQWKVIQGGRKELLPVEIIFTKTGSFFHHYYLKNCISNTTCSLHIAHVRANAAYDIDYIVKDYHGKNNFSAMQRIRTSKITKSS